MVSRHFKIDPLKKRGRVNKLNSETREREEIRYKNLGRHNCFEYTH
jgi:hypothetical protein